ncbi:MULTISPECIES: DUF1120 domain-containing protein [unclassified Enterobacter cloacae complex]|uniref:DUF1120 domain-containing protein n=1 Tax=unclassified Enterobacter cloacae complex TaxID=2757714 RepID=UPI00187299FB|nr:MULTISPECIES: DUF1120 domain-containing protein [unclassified Enterobacter cloacae complex]MBE4810069.1 DUF1120 domain-containing protein [Enterobacter cloacae complex sp. P44RS]MBE4827947.1 DUF1120 domain-containing protein [Enterobacter cloacae complex sp. P42RS]MBE4836253.1 DUF1120 domain-containing protein [Enterobacter cloacae complex sp. P46RS]MBE4839846.1 DUF1120 domain-containing protein [Enterobacter cloacae complex sp. P42C]
MLNNFMKTAVTAALLVSGIHAASAESVQVNVIGTIVPAACTPTLSGGGVVDYGNIKASTLSADAYTLLPVKSLDFAISCDAPARVALHAVNDRPGTLAGGEVANGVGKAPVNVFGNTSGLYPVVGLGLDGTKKIGGYGLTITGGTVTADGNPVDSITNAQNDGTGTWYSSGKGLGAGTPFSWTPRSISWAQTGTLVPVAFKTLAGKLDVQAYINKASELDLSHAVKLDGQTTLEVVYL